MGSLASADTDQNTSNSCSDWPMNMRIVGGVSQSLHFVLVVSGQLFSRGTKLMNYSSKYGRSFVWLAQCSPGVFLSCTTCMYQQLGFFKSHIVCLGYLLCSSLLIISQVEECISSDHLDPRATCVDFICELCSTVSSELFQWYI